MRPQRKLPIALMTVGSDDWRREVERQQTKRQRVIVALVTLLGACVYALVALCLR